MTETVTHDRWQLVATILGPGPDLRSVTAEWLDVVPPGLDDYAAAHGYAITMFGRVPDLWRVPAPASVFGAPVEWVDPVAAA